MLNTSLSPLDYSKVLIPIDKTKLRRAVKIRLTLNYFSPFFL